LGGGGGRGKDGSLCFTKGGEKSLSRPCVQGRSISPVSSPILLFSEIFQTFEALELKFQFLLDMVPPYWVTAHARKVGHFILEERIRNSK
jgi:hypothetical protein